MSGEWPLWSELGKKNGYQELILQSLKQLSDQLGINPPLTVGSVSVAGHSAGGSALGDVAAQLGDAIHDMTYEDGGYSDKPGQSAWKASHDKVAAWLLGGESDKLLRVLLHGENNHKEGSNLYSHFNDKSLEQAAEKLGKHGVKVTREEGNHDPRSADKGMYLDHTLHITGLHGTRTVSVFNMPRANHMQLRDRATEHLITEGRDTQFEGGGAPAAPKKDKKDEHPQEKPHEQIKPQGDAAAGPHNEHQAPTGGGDAKEPTKKDKPKVSVPVGKEVFADGGMLSHNHLGHGAADTDLTNKDKKKRHIHLDEEQYKFKQHVYDLCTARLKDHIYGGVSPEDLGKTENGMPYRKDCVPHLASLMSAMRSDLAAGKKVQNDKGADVEAPAKGDITVASAYRSPEHDRDLWDQYFQGYFIATMEEREKMDGGPLGEAAAKFMVTYIGKRKAAPGGSNHSNGNAVDLQPIVNGQVIHNQYDNQVEWRKSWHYFWLKANAHTYGFKNYPAEAWHWEWWA
jgi:hypothetical protein